MVYKPRGKDNSLLLLPAGSSCMENNTKGDRYIYWRHRRLFNNAASAHS